jgi:hypothetical protein
MAKKTNLKLKKPQLRKPSTAPIDAVRNPNFDAAMAQKNYDNFIAEQRARMEMERGSVPLTQSEIDKKYIDDGQGGRVLNPVDAAKLQLQFDQLRANIAANPGPSRNLGIDYIEGGQRYAPVNQGPQVGGSLGGKILTVIPEATNGAMASQYQNQQGPQVGGGMGGAISSPMVGYGSQQPRNMPIPNMPQNKMADFNNFLQQGMQRNKDFNQAAQNFAGMGGPQKSFSQVAGGIGKLNRMPKQPRTNSIAPSNQKLI